VQHLGRPVFAHGVDQQLPDAIAVETVEHRLHALQQGLQLFPRRRMRRASSSILTGWPMPSRNTSPPFAIDPACRTSEAASGMVMK